MTIENDLLEATYRLLDASELTYRKIAAGARVDFNWLLKFQQRAIAEPGVTKVQRLHNFLQAQPAPAVTVVQTGRARAAARRPSKFA